MEHLDTAAATELLGQGETLQAVTQGTICNESLPTLLACICMCYRQIDLTRILDSRRFQHSAALHNTHVRGRYCADLSWPDPHPPSLSILRNRAAYTHHRGHTISIFGEHGDSMCAGRSGAQRNSSRLSLTRCTLMSSCSRATSATDSQRTAFARPHAVPVAGRTEGV